MTNAETLSSKYNLVTLWCRIQETLYHFEIFPGLRIGPGASETLSTLAFASLLSAASVASLFQPPARCTTNVKLIMWNKCKTNITPMSREEHTTRARFGMRHCYRLQGSLKPDMTDARTLHLHLLKITSQIFIIVVANRRYNMQVHSAEETLSGLEILWPLQVMFACTWWCFTVSTQFLWIIGTCRCGNCALSAKQYK